MSILDDIFESVMVCKEHDCPRVYINGDYVCVIEYLDEIIGLERVSKVVENENVEVTLGLDATITLSCPCCGDSNHLHLDPSTAEDYLGLYVVSLSYEPENKIIFIHLSDTEDGDPIEGAFLPVSLDSVENIELGVKLNDHIMLKERTYGYSNIESRQQIGIIPEEEAAVKYLFQRFVILSERKSLSKTYKILVREAKEKGFPPPPEGWNKKSIEKILSDPIYVGRVSSDRIL